MVRRLLCVTIRRSCNLFFYSSNLLLDPLQLCLHVLQLVSAVQHLLALLLSGGGVRCAVQRDKQAVWLVCTTYYFSAIPNVKLPSESSLNPILFPLPHVVEKQMYSGRAISGSDVYMHTKELWFRSAKSGHTWCFKWYCVCSEASVCESGRPHKRDLDRIRVSVCVCVCAVSDEIQRQCGSVVVTAMEPAKQAVMWAKLPGASLVSLSLSLPLIHSLLTVP